MDNNVSDPFGDVGLETGRDAAGRFAKGNTAALVTGQKSTAFWAQAAGVLRDLEHQAIRDVGQAVEDATVPLQAVARGLAQATLVRDSAMESMMQQGGPLTSGNRTRRSFTVWVQASDRVEKYARLLGLEHRQRPGRSITDIIADYGAQQRAEREAAQPETTAPTDVLGN